MAEKLRGFDEAFWLSRDLLHFHFKHLLPSFGRAFLGLDPQDLNTLAPDISRSMPKFRFNFFVQYKRPEFVQGPRGTERRHWNQPYYRYRTTQHQQETLERLHDIANGRAAVIYASPATWEIETLFKAAQEKRIIAISNVVTADLLAGHGKYTYVSGGGYGKAFSEPVEIRCSPLEEIMASALRQEAMPFNQHMKVTAQAIEKALKPKSIGARRLNLARQAIVGDRDEVAAIGPVGSFTYALATIQAFCDIFGLSYYAVG